MNTNGSTRSKRVLVSLPVDVHEAVVERAQREGKQPGDVIREAVGNHVKMRAQRRTIAEAAREAIRNGATNDEALAAVQREFPNSSTGLDSIRWYRNRLRRDGEKVPTDPEVRQLRGKGERK